MLTYTIAFWLLSRFVWLPLIARDQRASAFRHAARQTAVIFVAHVLWLIGVAVIGFSAMITASLISTTPLDWINIPWVVLLLATMILGPAVIWWRVISADTLRYEFPRRIWAGLLLIGCIVASLVPPQILVIWPRLW